MVTKNEAPHAPDYGPLIAASRAQSDQANALAQTQFKWAQTAYAADKTITDKTSAAMLDSMTFQNDNAKKDRARYDQTFAPLEGQMAADASSYNSPEKRDQMAGRAVADVGQQWDAQRASAQRDLESYGLNPSSTRHQALDLGLRSQEAAQKAAAASNSNLNTENTARALRAQAVDVGRGLPGQVSNSAAGATGAGASGVNSALSGTQTGASTMGTSGQYMGIGANALGGAAGMMGQQYAGQMSEFNANQAASSGLGTVLGGALGLGVKAATGNLTGSLLGNALGIGKIPGLYAEGGPVADGPAAGGALDAQMAPHPQGPVPVSSSPSRGAALDDVPAKLTPGEFVIPKDVSAWLGQKHLYNIMAKAREERAGGGAPKPAQRQQAIPGR